MANTEKRAKEKVISMGSGTCYMMEYTGELPERSAICVDENRFAYTKSGATIKYGYTTQKETDDLGLISKTVVVEDSAEMSLGVIGWIGETFQKVISTARVSTDESGYRRTKIGGVGNDNRKSWVIVFHHPDPVDGDCWWWLVGKNTADLEFAYKTDGSTVLSPTFTAEAMDDEGTLLMFDEEIGTTAG